MECVGEIGKHKNVSPYIRQKNKTDFLCERRQSFSDLKRKRKIKQEQTLKKWRNC